MKPITTWNRKPYARFSKPWRALLPYVCRIEPGENSFAFEWFDNGFSGRHTVSIRKYLTLKPEQTFPLDTDRFYLDGLEDEQDYEFVIHRVGMDGESTQRLVRTGAVPSTIINYIHPLDTALDYAGSFIGSPTITKLPPGDLLACTDIFGGAEDMGLVFKSSDGGESWRYVTELISCQWPRPFVLK